MLLHLLKAVVVGVDEVEGQRSRQRAASSPRWDAQKPADGSDVLLSTHCDVGTSLNTACLFVGPESTGSHGILINWFI